MNKIHSIAMIILTMGSSTVLAYDTEARVLNVEPLTERIANQDRCSSQNLYNNNNVQQKSYTGSIVGAIAGGLLGAQVGKGNGQVAAAAVGAATGAMVGDNLGNNNQNSTPSYTCSEPTYTYRTSGYRVTYVYDNREYVTNMPYDPGNRLPISVQITPRY